MGIISNLIPLNYLEEKEKFLKNPTNNPQFKYLKKFSKKTLGKYGLPKEKYLKIAQNILDKALEIKTPQEILADRGKLLTKEEVEKAILEFLKENNLEKRFSIVWKKNLSSRTMINASTISLKLPCSVYKNDLLGLLYHELGTHAIRRVNYEQQPWYKKKSKYGFVEYLPTEEGLAVIHTIFSQQNSFAYSSAFNYLASDLAQKSSFLDVYNFLIKYLPHPEKAFNSAFRKKRGIEDTSQPGGFTKDVVYFEGFVEVVRFLLAKNFPLEELYFGKMAWQDIIKAVEMNPKFKPLMPDFYTDDPEKYKARVKEIAETNGLSN